MAATQKVNFEVVKINIGDEPGFVNIDVKFEGSDKVYSYYRRYGNNGAFCFVIISGCRVTFIGDTVVSIIREYDVKGNYRRSTKSISGKRRKRAIKDIDIDLSDDNNGLPTKSTKEIIEEPNETKEEEIIDVPLVKEEKVSIIPKKIRHEQYDTIISCLEEDIPIYLVGPAGSGKNYTLEQIARERGWNFYYTNSVQQEYKLTGFIDAGGRYHETEFYKACADEEECMFFLDELDASIPEVLVLLNAAIANGYFEFPTGKVMIGNVHFVAAGNTVGSGADEMYTGRMVIDQSTLDRFAIIEFDYSEVIENKITNGNKDLIKFIHDVRSIAKNNGIRATFSYRCMTMTCKLENKGLSLDKIMRIAIMKGLDQDTINTMRLYGTTRYHEALRKIQN